MIDSQEKKMKCFFADMTGLWVKSKTLSTERFWEPLENKIVKRSAIVKLTKLSNKTNGHCLQFVTKITDRPHTL